MYPGDYRHIVCQNLLIINISVYFYALIPYLLVYNARDFTQIIYFVGGMRIIDKNNVFQSFSDRKITCRPYFFSGFF